jgi:hypothetical protein
MKGSLAAKTTELSSTSDLCLRQSLMMVAGVPFRFAQGLDPAQKFAIGGISCC